MAETTEQTYPALERQLASIVDRRDRGLEKVERRFHEELRGLALDLGVPVVRIARVLGVNRKTVDAWLAPIPRSPEES